MEGCNPFLIRSVTSWLSRLSIEAVKQAAKTLNDELVVR